MLYKVTKDKSKWDSLLAEWISSDIHRARLLIQGEKPTEKEIIEIAERNQLSDENLLWQDVVKEAEMFQENIKFLFDEIELNSKRKLAKGLRVSKDTVTAWMNKGRVPIKDNQGTVLDFFGLPQDTDLNNNALFLSLDPVTELAKRNWLKKRIDTIKKEELIALYPALEKLLEDK